MSWRDCLVGDFVDAGLADIQTGPFGTQLRARDYVADGIPVINVRNIGYGDVRAEKLEYVNEQTAERLFVHLLSENDILFGRKGAVDRHLFVKNGNKGWMQSSDCIRIKFNSPDILPAYVSYVFRTKEHRKWMLGQSGNKSTMASLNQEIIKRIPIKLPSPVIQREIADILSAYDDLIENNQQRIQLLEESARLLYREWFVHLRFPGHEHVKVVNGVPEGWERVLLSTITSFLKRGITPLYDDDAPGVVINQKCIRDGRINMNLARHQSKEVKEEKRVRNGDVLVNSTGEGTLGRVAQVKASVANCTADSHITIVRPLPDIRKHWFGLALREWEPRFCTMGKGATNQTELSPATIGATTIVMPSESLRDQFELFADPIYQQVTTLLAQNDKLIEARDLLLPRLMSGELTV